MKSLYDNYIFDFDGTIVDLQLDWNNFRTVINSHCQKHKIPKTMPLPKKIIELGKISSKFLDLVYLLEVNNGNPNYKIIEKIANFIDSLDQQIFIISNNHSKTIRDILIREKLLKNCKLIIGIDKVMTPKPNHEPFKYIQSLIKNGKSLYIGDKETDQQFANAAKLDFIFVDNF